MKFTFKGQQAVEEAQMVVHLEALLVAQKEVHLEAQLVALLVARREFR